MNLFSRINTIFGFRERKPAATYDRFLLEFLRGLSRVVEESQLSSLATSRLREWLGASRMVLFARRDRGEEYRPLSMDGSVVNGSIRDEHSRLANLSPNSRLAGWIAQNDRPIYLSNHSGVLSHFSADERQLLTTLRINLCLPLTSIHQLNGFLLAGGVEPKRAQSACEDPWMRIILTHLGLAMEHAHLVARQRTRLRQMYWADRLAIAGQLATGAAHEIRNPLTVVRSTIQHLSKHLADDEHRKQVEGLIEEVDRIDSIVQGLLSFARPTKDSEEVFLVRDELASVFDLLASQARKAKVTLTIGRPYPEARVRGDRAKVRQVFLNLAMNALQAMPEGGTLSVQMTRGRLERGEHVVIEFRDTGIGIAQEHLENIFDPFYTTRRDGTGLGLSISYGIIAKHGGRIMVESEVGEGTTFIVELPLVMDETTTNDSPQSSEPPTAGPE